MTGTVKKDLNQNIRVPYSSRKAFEERENISKDDFIYFKGSHILLVEDNEINQKIVQNLLKKSGIEVTIANHGQEALDILLDQKKPVDLILMDISMPVMDGYETTRIIREKRLFDTVPIVTFTAFTSQGSEIERMFDAGANSYITKPLKIGQLYSVFLSYLTNTRREISFLEELKIDGLDTDIGLALAKNNEEVYRKSLFDFVVDYKVLIHGMPKWIDNEASQNIISACSKMGIDLRHIGAYELEELVFRMKKIYIYNTEHRIEEFRDIFPKKLEKLVLNIERYLTSG